MIYWGMGFWLNLDTRELIGCGMVIPTEMFRLPRDEAITAIRRLDCTSSDPTYHAAIADTATPTA
jgi:hypothetical protein